MSKTRRPIFLGSLLMALLFLVVARPGQRPDRVEMTCIDYREGIFVCEVVNGTGKSVRIDESLLKYHPRFQMRSIVDGHIPPPSPAIPPPPNARDCVILKPGGRLRIEHDIGHLLENRTQGRLPVRVMFGYAPIQVDYEEAGVPSPTDLDLECSRIIFCL